MKYYHLHQKIVNENEAKEFIGKYYNAILKGRSRFSDMKTLIGNGNILDYGCGWGCFSKLLSEQGNNVLGIDIDEESLKIAKEIVGESKNLHFKKMDIKDLEKDIFDYVVSAEVLEHTHNPGNYLVECNRVLKKNGYLIISIPNNITVNVILNQIRLRKDDFLKINAQNNVKTRDHIQAWDPKTFCKLLISLGFHYEHHILSEGVPVLKKYIRYHIPVLSKFSYTITFKFRKEHNVEIKDTD